MLKALKTTGSLLTLAIGLFTACSNDEPMPAKTGELVPLDIIACIDMQAQFSTRAFETSWEANDKIGVYMTERNTTTIYKDAEQTEGKNMPYTFDDGINYETYINNSNTYRLFTPNTKKIYLSETKVDVYGYYPYKDNAELNPTLIGINVSNQNSQKAIDFMRAQTRNVNNENIAVELLFQHRLTKLVFNLKQGEGLLEDELKDADYLGMTIGGQPIEATYSIYSDILTIIPGNNDISPVRASSAPTGYVRTFEAIVLPNGSGNPNNPCTITITFYRHSNDQIVNTFQIHTDGVDGSVYFEKGYKYTYNVTVNATSIQVDPQIYTEQW